MILKVTEKDIEISRRIHNSVVRSERSFAKTPDYSPLALAMSRSQKKQYAIYGEEMAPLDNCSQRYRLSRAAERYNDMFLRAYYEGGTFNSTMKPQAFLLSKASRSSFLGE